MKERYKAYSKIIFDTKSIIILLPMLLEQQEESKKVQWIKMRRLEKERMINVENKEVRI
jgi:hypothetical protein